MTPALVCAQPSSATAESLFQEGKRALDEGRYDVACPKLGDSMQLEPAGGVALLYAVCLDGQGRLASAWAAYNVALALAKRDHRADRETQAGDRARTLLPTLPRITLVIAPTPAVEIRLDGRVVPASAWGSPLPVDPGAHTLSATAPGYRASDMTMSARVGETTELEFPALSPVPAATAPTAVVASSGAPTRERFAYAAFGASAVSLTLGIGFGVAAIRKASAANDRCPAADCTDSRGVELNGQAKTAAVAADIGFAAGLGFAGIGALLLVLGPSSKGVAIFPTPTGFGARAGF